MTALWLCLHCLPHCLPQWTCQVGQSGPNWRPAEQNQGLQTGRHHLTVRPSFCHFATGDVWSHAAGRHPAADMGHHPVGAHAPACCLLPGAGCLQEDFGNHNTGHLKLPEAAANALSTLTETLSEFTALSSKAGSFEQGNRTYQQVASGEK